jgi:uncharacterized protein
LKTKIILATMAMAMLVSTPVVAQFSDSYNFLKAVRERNGAEVEKFLGDPGNILNTATDSTTGDRALHIVVQQRNPEWLSFLLGRGAKPDYENKKGVTPLMLATQLNFIDGIDRLLARKANVDHANNAGETALILAVQLRNSAAVRLLLKAGANADKRDNRAGYSARDYAKQDSRAGAILAIIEANDKKAKAPEPKALDFSGIGEKKD